MSWLRRRPAAVEAQLIVPFTKAHDAVVLQAKVDRAGRIIAAALSEQDCLEPDDRNRELQDVLLDLKTALGLLRPSVPVVPGRES